MPRLARTRSAAWIALALASAAAIALIGLEARGTTLRGDEFGYAHQLATEPLLEAVFDSRPGKYLLAVPMLIYAVLFETFGIESYLPYRLAGLGLLVLAAVLFFVLARRRIGELPALIATVPLLFLGSASEVVVIPLRLPSQVAVCAGLGAMLMLDREDRRGDLGACALGTVAITSHPIGLAFVAASAVRVLGSAPRRWRRAWAFAVPLVAYAAWWLTLRSPPQTELPVSLGDVLEFAAESLAAFSGAVTGFFRAPWVDGIDLVNPITALLGVAVVVVVALRLRNPPRLDPALLGALAALAVAVIAPALAPGGARVPHAPRYLYPGAIILLWVLVEAARGLRLRGNLAIGAWTLAAMLLVTGLYSNVQMVRDRADVYIAASDLLKAKLGGLELIRGQIEDRVERQGDVGVEAPGGEATPADVAVAREIQSGEDLLPGADIGSAIYDAVDDVYFQVADAYGSVGYAPKRIASRPLVIRRSVDADLARQLGLRLEPIPAARDADGASIEPERLFAARAGHGPGCTVLQPSAGTDPTVPGLLPAPPGAEGSPPLAEFELPARGAAIEVERNGRFSVRLGRFAQPPGYPVPGGRAGAVSLDLPVDAASGFPWHFIVYSTAPVRVCRL